MAAMPSTLTASPMMSTTASTASPPPPPYSREDIVEEEESDLEDDEPAPMKVTINASHSIVGKQNIVPPPPLITTEVVKFASVLMNEMRQHNEGIASQNTSSAHSSSFSRQRRRNSCLRVDFTINYDVKISGDRNVMGNVSIRPRPAQHFLANNSINSSTSVKRKADEDVESASKRCCPEP